MAYHWVRRRQQVSELINKSLILDQLRVDVVQLGHAHRCGLLHVRILVFQAFTQRVAEVSRDLVHSDAAHGAYGQGADQWIGVLTILGNIKSFHDLKKTHFYFKIILL